MTLEKEISECKEMIGETEGIKHHYWMGKLAGLTMNDDDRKALEQRNRILESSFRRKAQKYAFLEKKFNSVSLENTLLKKSTDVRIIEQKSRIEELEKDTLICGAKVGHCETCKINDMCLSLKYGDARRSMAQARADEINKAKHKIKALETELGKVLKDMAKSEAKNINDSIEIGQLKLKLKKMKTNKDLSKIHFCPKCQLLVDMFVEKPKGVDDI